jgi:hypothetical protein
MSESSYRISLPQIDDALILTRTCPFPGFGIGSSRNTTVESPGRITPRIIFVFLSSISLDVVTYSYHIRCSLSLTYAQSNETIYCLEGRPLSSSSVDEIIADGTLKQLTSNDLPGNNLLPPVEVETTVDAPQ